MHAPKPQSRTRTSVCSGQFYVNLIKLSHMRGEIILDYTQACRTFLFVFHVGAFNLFNHPWTASLVFYKKACWVSHEEQAIKQQSSMNSAPSSSFRFSSQFEFPPWLSLMDCDSIYVRQIKCFLPKVLMAMMFHRSYSDPHTVSLVNCQL